MLQTMFMILKIIGLVLLIALAVIFFLLLSILFIPIRYRIHGSYYEKAEGTVKVNWFLHLLSIKAWYAGESNVRIRIFGIPIYDARRRESKQSKQKSKSKRSPEKSKNNIVHQAESKAENKETLKEEPLNGESAKEELLNEKPASVSDQAETINTKTIQTEAANTESISIKLQTEAFDTKDKNNNNEKKKFMIKEKFPAFIYKIKNTIKNFIHKIKYTIKRICDKIKLSKINCDKAKQIYANIQYFWQLMQSDEMKEAFSLCKKQLYLVWKNVKPGKFQVYLHIGTEDPSITGEIMALYGMLYPFVGNQIQVVPEFQETILEGTVKAKGHITVFVLIKVFIRVYFDKNIRHLLQLLNKEVSHGRE